jgi:hypothetical protein
MMIAWLEDIIEPFTTQFDISKLTINFNNGDVLTCPSNDLIVMEYKIGDKVWFEFDITEMIWKVYKIETNDYLTFQG